MNKDDRAEQILESAAEVFFEKGYDRASVRDVARTSGMSLAGLYYHFPSKEAILHRIQERVFTDLIEGARRRTESVTDPRERLEIFIRTHLSYFIENLTEMKVLSHEFHRLKGEDYDSLAALRRHYYGIAEEIVAELAESGVARDVPVRVSVLALFGMMNWLYTWYRPARDPAPAPLSTYLTTLFLHGLLRQDI